MRSIEETAIQALERALPAGIATVTGSADDAEIVLRTGATVPISVRWAGAGYPRDVGRALRDRPRDRQLILVAEAFSPGSRVTLREQGVSWLGLDGSTAIDLGGAVFIERESTAADPTRRTSRTRVTPWTPSSSDVAETLLTTLIRPEADAPLRPVPLLTELAARSGRSLGAVSGAVRAFEEQGWITASLESGERTRGRRPPRVVTDPGALLDAWAGFQREQSGGSRFTAQDRRFHVLDRDPETIAKRISDVFDDRVIFGGLVAADRIAPYATGISTVRCYVDESRTESSFDRLAHAAGLTPTAAGARVIFSPVHRPVLQAASLARGLRIASPVRTYIDLLQDSIRGDEPAEHLRRVAIGF